MKNVKIAQLIFQWLRGDASFNQEAWDTKLDEKQKQKIIALADKIIEICNSPCQ